RVRALAVGELLDVARADIHRVDVRPPAVVFGVGPARGAEDDRLRVGSPLGRAVVVITFGQLPRRAARVGDDEDVRETFGDVTRGVGAIIQPVNHLRRVNPLRAGRARRHFDG